MKSFVFRGFTLVELIIAIAVIGVLSGVLVTVINPVGQINKANDGKRKADIAALQSALEQYRFDNSSYPATISAGCGAGTSFSSGGITYLQTVPCDPGGSTPYHYAVDSTTGNYCLRACLARQNDKDADIAIYGSDNANSCSATFPTCPAGTSYTVVSQ